jgi:hypothetical protein
MKTKEKTQIAIATVTGRIKLSYDLKFGTYIRTSNQIFNTIITHGNHIINK